MSPSCGSMSPSCGSLSPSRDCISLGRDCKERSAAAIRYRSGENGVLPRSRSAAFFLDGFEFRQCLQIPGTASGPLGPYQLRKTQAQAAHLEYVQLDRIRQQIPIAATTRNLAEQVDRAQRSNQRKIETALERGAIPEEGQSWGSAARIRFVNRQRRS